MSGYADTSIAPCLGCGFLALMVPGSRICSRCGTWAAQPWQLVGAPPRQQFAGCTVLMNAAGGAEKVNAPTV